MNIYYLFISLNYWSTIRKWEYSGIVHTIANLWQNFVILCVIISRSPSGTLHPRDASTTVRSRSRSRSRSPRGYSSGRHLGQMNGDDIFTLRSSLSSADVSLSRPWFTLPVLRNTGTDSQRYGANPFVSLSGRVLLSLISRVHSSTKSSSSQPSAEPPTSTTAADDRRTAPKLLVRPPAGDVQVPAYLDFRSRDSAENTNELAASCIVWKSAGFTSLINRNTRHRMLLTKLYCFCFYYMRTSYICNLLPSICPSGQSFEQ